MFELDQRNEQVEVEPVSKEIDELENKTRRLLEGPLKAKTEKCLKSLLEMSTEGKLHFILLLKTTYLIKSEKYFVQITLTHFLV